MEQRIVTKIGRADTLVQAPPGNIASSMKRFIVILSLIVAAAPAFAQRGERDQKGFGPGKQQGMSKDERQRMRDDMRDVYRERNRQDRPQQRPLSPQEREKLRRDIQDANRDLRR
jgi:hypothetical protein